MIGCWSPQNLVKLAVFLRFIDDLDIAIETMQWQRTNGELLLNPGMFSQFGKMAGWSWLHKLLKCYVMSSGWGDLYLGK